MDTNKELLDLIKYFGELIKDLNGTFFSLSGTINGLFQQVGKLPEAGQIDHKLNLLEDKLINVMNQHVESRVDLSDVEDAKRLFTDQIKDLGFKLDKLNSITDFMNRYYLGDKESEKNSVELEKKKLELQEIVITQTAETSRSKIKVWGELGLKFIALVGAVIAGVFTIWKLVIEKVPEIDPKIQQRTIQSTPFIKK